MGEANEFKIAYDYDASGRLARASDGVVAVEYRYDARGGLVASGPAEAAQDTAAARVFCMACGTPAASGDAFCSKCGAPVAS